MKTKQDILGDLRRMMDSFVGQMFTDEMRQRIRLEATDLMNTAFDEGQTAMAPHVCANRRTPDCKLVEADEEYDLEICRKCNMDGGFAI
jgi:hypothetical protein